MTPTAREGRNQVVEFVIDSTHQLDHITGWWPRSVAYAQECGLDGGDEGASYGYMHLAPQGTDPIGDAERIADYWESLGMSVRTTNTDTYPVVYAEGGPVLRASFATNGAEGNYDIGAVMPCGTGNAITLNAEDEARRDAGETLPGDEGVIPVEDPRDAWKTPTPTPSDTE